MNLIDMASPWARADFLKRALKKENYNQVVIKLLLLLVFIAVILAVLSPMLQFLQFH